MELSTKFREFSDARDFVRKLGLKSYREWRKYVVSGEKPEDIPATPDKIYKKEWKGYSDWLGHFTKHTGYKKILPYDEAKKIVHKLGLNSSTEWRDYIKTHDLPEGVPYNPLNKYKKEWKDYKDWLGIQVEGSKYGRYRDFQKAREIIRSQKIIGVKGWWNYCKSGKKPVDIPAHPDRVYKNEWKGYEYWLGQDARKAKYKKFRSFEDGRAFVRSLKLKNTSEWFEYKSSEKKPTDIPSTPELVYKEKWKGIGDWIGTFVIAPQKKQFLPFEKARESVRSLGLKSYAEWLEYSRSGKKPEGIPTNPEKIYEREWVDTYDWIGIEDPTWSAIKVKELLRDLVKSGIIYQWDEAVLYSFLNRKGLLNLNNRHSQFFKNLLDALKFPEGREAIEEYAYTETNIPPNLSQFKSTTIEIEESVDSEIPEATSEELAELIEDSEPLDYGKLQPVENILRHTDFLESINVDEEAMRFYVNYSLSQLWKNAFANESDTIDKIKQERKNGNKYHDKVLETFLNDYKKTKELSIPQTYSFPEPLRLMQKYVAYKIKNNPFYGNFSGTGAGKTLSAVLASRVIDSKLTLIVCPNEVVNHWEKHILEIFPDSRIITGKDAFHVKYNENHYQYAILNYDKFNQPHLVNLILKLGNEKIDFVVLDEIHFSKIRDKNVSIRRHNLDGLMTSIRKKNNKVKVLGVSATPVVNNLHEGRSLIELISGKIFDDVATRPTISNAVTLYEKLSNISIREMPNYPIAINTNIIEVEQNKPKNLTIKQLKSNPLSIEQSLTDARLPEIIKLIDGQTIIYTEYVEKIIQKISEAVRSAGYSFALHTGTDHSGLEKFLAKKVQVLIASRPISTGIDGLQKICNRLIINTLPWTNALYQQLLGRLVRLGQIEDVVNVYIVKASIAGYPYDQLKLDRIKFKKTLADCAVDGILPEKNLVTPAQATAEAIRWLERLEQNEISTITRRDLNVKLSPVEIEQRIRKYGDFEKLNQQINIEKSETTHLRLIKNPEEWLEYHRQYREARKSWSIIPYEEWIRRLKVLSPRLQIGDFGCGEAKIMEEIGDRVKSFDHVAINNQVIPCDIRNVPLEDGSFDVVIFSLSLMGKNWIDYIKEAKRCLATNGYLFIAETTRALKSRLAVLHETLNELGFEIYQDNELDLFTFIEARKL